VHLNQDDGDNLVIVERWQSRPHYEKYFAWRQETGLLDRLGPLLGAPPSVRFLDETGI
jgi:quinol monooxygenase YgiN